MRIIPFLCFLFLGCILNAQTMDTAAVRLEVDSLIALNRDLVREGKYDQALQLIQQAEEKCLATFGDESTLYAYCLNQHGILYFYQGKFSQAIPLCLQSKTIRAKVLGEEHPLYAKNLNLLAILYTNLGRYDKAEGYFLEASAIWERTLGKEHPSYARSLNNVAILYRRMGKYEKAEQLYLESKAIKEKNEKNSDYALTLNNLAIFYEEMGAYKKAEPLYLEAAAVYEKVSGKEHPDLQAIRKNLADLYQEMGDYEKAETNYLEAKAIREKTLGKDHHFYASSLSGLAELYRKMKRYEEAESLFLEAKAIVQRTMGENNIDYTYDLLNLGNLYFDMERYQEAEALYREAIAIDEKILGKTHPKYASDLSALAALYVRTGQFEKAEPLLTTLFNNLQAQLQAAFSFLSENEKEKFIRTQIEPYIAQIQSAALHIHSPAFQSLQYDVALLMKGVRLQASQRTLTYILQQQDPQALETYLNLLGVRRRLARQYQRPVAERQEIEMLEKQQEDLEKQLARLSATFRREQASVDIAYEAVKASLKPGEAAVEFVHFPYMNPASTDSVLYGAVVLLPDDTHPHFVPLFEEKKLTAWLGDVGVRRLDYVDRLYTFSDWGVGKVNEEEEELPGLYELIWRPIDSLLQGIQTVYYSSSGLLHWLNLGAVPVDAETSLSGAYHLRALAGTRLLALPQEEENAESRNVVIYGGVQYDYDSTALAEAINNLEIAPAVDKEGEVLAFAYTKRSQRGGSWKYLRWTEKEGEAIHQLLLENDYAVQFHHGYQATEESFKQLGVQSASPHILHLATHGFFFPDDPAEAGANGVDNRSGVEVSAFRRADHPMIRSGLILAGANGAWNVAEPVTGREDGILTAFEVSQVNLSGTELVILSACETGLGEIHGSEGVFGLQRAFKMAGARYLIMSLWQVPDFQTQDLMVTFYTRWLEEKMTIPEAFRAAQQEMREKYMNPYFWAGFVLVE